MNPLLTKIGSQENPLPYYLGNRLTLPAPSGCTYLLEVKKRKICVEPNIFRAKCGDVCWQQEVVGLIVKADGASFHKDSFGGSLTGAKLKAVEHIKHLSETKKTIQWTKGQKQAPKWLNISLSVLAVLAYVLCIFNFSSVLGVVGIVLGGLGVVAALILAIKY